MVFKHLELSKTFGINQNEDIVSKTITIDGKKQVFVNYDSNINDLRKIESTTNSGEVIYIRANRIDNSGSLHIYSYDTTSNSPDGQNIYLGGETSITLNNGEWASFIKVDNPVSVTGPGGPAAPHTYSTYQLLSRSHHP